MGQAVVDLPDPMEQPPAGSNADDLLSQLAGDEIDRLLGEADVDTAAEAAAEANLSAGDAAAPGEPLGAEPAIDMAAMLDEAQAVAEADLAAGAPAAAPAPEASGELDHTISAAADNVLGPSPTAEVDRDALFASVSSDAADDVDPSLPLILRPLEWFSAPLESLSPTAREFLGKAAIVTLVNSIAVIAYVIWFRK